MSPEVGDTHDGCDASLCSISYKLLNDFFEDWNEEGREKKRR